MKKAHDLRAPRHRAHRSAFTKSLVPIILLGSMTSFLACSGGERQTDDDDDGGGVTAGVGAGTSTQDCDGYTPSSCQQACVDSVGVTEGTCQGDTCQCGGDFTDPECAWGVIMICSCDSSGEGPTGANCETATFDWGYYISCAIDGYDDLERCLASYVQSDGTYDCNEAFIGCG